MSSTHTPGVTARESAPSARRTPIGVDVGEHRLVTAAPVDGAPEEAFTIDGEPLRDTYRELTAACSALNEVGVDTSRAETQLVYAFWVRRLKGIVHDAAHQVVEWARSFPAPVLVLEDLGYGEWTLWERRYAGSNAGTWMMPALQAVLQERAVDAGIPVARVAPERTSRECHRCGADGELGAATLRCPAEDCPVERVCRDASAALSIAARFRNVADD